MEALTPSRTAQGAAMHRAAHQLLDTPPIFEDPLAVRIIGPEAEQELRGGTDWHARDRAGGLRAFIAMRSRLAEDGLSSAVARGIRQYVLLGAGLDTFAYRAGDGFSGVTIFEIDHPATQAWKRARLEELAIYTFECGLRAGQLRIGNASRRFGTGGIQFLTACIFRMARSHTLSFARRRDGNAQIHRVIDG
jgi:O-methyltransferase involved in polyketide biosynthesis